MRLCLSHRLFVPRPTRWLILTLLLGAAAARAADRPLESATPLPRETGRPLLRQFSFRDYHAHHQMWSAVEDQAGLLYFGNKGCVLEYDGVTWRTLPIPDTTFVRGLAVASDGTLFAGGVDQLGYFAVAPTGEKTFVSLRDRLPEAKRNFGDLWQVVATRDGVFFCADRLVMRWRDGAFHLWDFPPGSPPNVYNLGDEVFLHRRDEALWRLRGDEFEVAADGPRLRARRIRGLVRLDDGRLLATSISEGLIAIDAAGRESPFPSFADAWIANAGGLSTARDADRLFIGSAQDGAMLLDPAGRFIRHLNAADGLRDPSVKAIAPVSSGAVWLCLNNGLARLAPPRNQTFFTTEQGLDGSTVRAFARHNGALYAATGRTIHRLAPADSAAGRNARFIPDPAITGQFYSLLAVSDGLLGGEIDALWWFPDHGPATVVRDHVTALALRESRVTPGRVWAAGERGLLALDRTADGWRATPLPAPLQLEARSIVECDHGYLWLGTFTRGIVRVRWSRPGSLEAPDVTFMRDSHGLPPGLSSFHLALAGPYLFAHAGDGSDFRWNSATDRFERVRAAELPASGTDANCPADSAMWLIGAGGSGPPERLREYTTAGTVRDWDFRELLATTGPLQQVFAENAPDGRRVLWLAGAEGVARVEPDVPSPAAAAPGVVLRAARHDASGAWPAGHVLPAGHHRLEFEFSASAEARDPQFSTRLEGAEDEWSPWGAARSREFSNLPPGDYVFRVRVRDGALAGRAEPSFGFRITAPWWAALWARGALALLGAGAIAGIVRWRLGALRRRADELEHTIARRTAELQASNEQLQLARDAAETANRAKSTFLAHMSHELRTPLNGILGYAQILARDPAQTDAARSRLRVINASGQHLLGLINEVLDLARVESGKMPVHVAPCALPALLEGVADLLRGPSETAGLKFEVETAPDLPRLVHTDEQKLRQVLLNLLGNAVKFTRRGGVRFTVARQPGGRVHFAVADTGPGIAPERLAEIFQPFSSTAADGVQGTGLGLALSQRMVELLGGRLHVESTLGAGSRFWFDLPLPEVAGEAPARAAATDRTPLGYAGPRRHLLIVDDDATNRAVLRELLEPLGFTTAEAANDDATLAAARAQRPDAVLLDLRFQSGGDGFSIARRLRAEPALRGLKIIAVSASVFESDRHEAIAAGCDDFLAKPFQERQLYACLGAALGLDWIRAPEEKAARGPGAATPPLAAEIRAELLELARRGDARRLQARLAELAAGPQPAAELARLQELAASFQMKRLRDLLSSDAEDHPDR